MRVNIGKIFFCLIACFLFLEPSLVFAQDETLEITNYINDYANLIDSSTEEKLNQTGKEFEEQTGSQVVFITVNSLNGQDIRQVAYNTFQKYQLGAKDVDNGILFIVSLQDKERYMEVGTGLEGTITDIASQHLQTEYLVPKFQQEQYQQGLEDLYYQTIDAIQNGIDEGELSPSQTESEENNGFFAIFTTFIFVIVLFMLVYFTSNSHGSAISLKPGQRYKLKIRGYNFDDESILVSSKDPDIVSVEANGTIQGNIEGKTTIYLQKLTHKEKKSIPVIVSKRRNNSSSRNDKLLEYMIWGSMLSNRHHRTTRNFGSSGFGSGGFGGFSGGGGSSRGGGAGGSW